MRERIFLHSSAYVLRSPCGEARRASLLAPLGTLRGQTQPTVGFTASRPSGKPRTKTVISATRRKQVFYTEERFADKPNLRPSGWLYPLRSTAWRISLAPLALRSGNLHRMLCLLRCAQKSKPFVL